MNWHRNRGTGPSLRFNHHILPEGMVLTFVTTKGSTIKVQLLAGVFEGHSRNVKVLEAPIEYDDSLVPTIMCVVPPDAHVELMAHAYQAARTDVEPGDTVYLIDRYVDGPVPKFVVRSVS